MDAVSVQTMLPSWEPRGPMPLTRRERLAAFLERLLALPRVSTAEAALDQVRRTLIDVEDELSGLPDRPEVSGRMYPPRDDSRRDVPGSPEVVRYRTKRHNVFIRSNGAIEIRLAASSSDRRNGQIELETAGVDGRKVWDA